MCGVAGILNLSGDNLEKNRVKLMIDEINHRGPDFKDFYIDEYISLGHARLSIIDLSESANQPFYWRERYVIVFNGEIYNYLEIKKELINKGISFKTNSDTEVLIAAYEFWGEDCQNKFNGMWAFLIWDKLKKSLFVSRDRFGIKPLYWCKHKKDFYFSSEIKQLNKIGIGNAVNAIELSNFLYGGIVSYSNDTFIEGIKSLKGGNSILINSRGNLKLKEWYSLSSELEKFKYREEEDIIELLKHSVQLRMRSDVKIGSCLSGGIDSSSIASIFSKNYNSEHPEFEINLIHGRSIDSENDESNYAKKAAAYSKNRLEIITPKSKDFWDNVAKICYLQDEPFGSPSIFMQYFVMKRARELGCKVMLDGQGADEILLGYSKYINLIFHNEIRNLDIMGLLKLFKNDEYFIGINNFFDKAKYIAGPLIAPLRAFRIKKRLDFLDLPIDNIRDIYRKISSVSRDMQSTQILEVNNTSLPALLRYEDRNSMANSIEARVPFLDHRVVEASISLSFDSKIKNGWSKYPLRNSNLLPKAIAWRRSKLGFNAPERTWIGLYDNEIKDIVLGSNIINSITNKTKLEKKWKLLDNKEKWRLFNTSIWSEAMKVKL